MKTGTCTRAYRKGCVAQQLGARGKTFSVEQCSAGSRGMRTLRGMADRRRRLGWRPGSRSSQWGCRMQPWQRWARRPRVVRREAGCVCNPHGVRLWPVSDVTHTDGEGRAVHSGAAGCSHGRSGPGGAGLGGAGQGADGAGLWRGGKSKFQNRRLRLAFLVRFAPLRRPAQGETARTSSH